MSTSKLKSALRKDKNVGNESRKGTQKRVRHNSKSPEKLVFEKQFEEGEKKLLWEKNAKDFNELVNDQLEEDFKEKHPFDSKTQSQINRLSPKKKEDYEREHEDHKKKLEQYKLEHFKTKRMDIHKKETSRHADKQSHYYKLKNFDKIPLGPRKSQRRSIKSAPVPVQKINPDDVIRVRRSEPVPKAELRDIRKEKVVGPKKEQSVFSGLFKSASSMFSRGGKRRTQKRKS